VYGDAHVARLRFMARAKRLGLRLEEIAELARAWDDEPCAITHGQLVGLLDRKLTQVHDEIVELTRFADQLAAVYERVTGRPREARPLRPRLRLRARAGRRHDRAAGGPQLRRVAGRHPPLTGNPRPRSARHVRSRPTIRPPAPSARRRAASAASVPCRRDAAGARCDTC
jgi:DNA-binding transcriptional MerR regulator